MKNQTTKKETAANIAALAEMYGSRTEAETIEQSARRFAAAMTAETLRDTLAALVIANSYDGRIKRDTAEHARRIGSPFGDGEYIPHAADIHRAHLDQLAAYVFAHYGEIKHDTERAQDATMPTAEEIREEMKRTRDQIAQAEAREDAALQEWRDQINSAGGLKKYLDETPHESRAIRKADEAQAEAARLKDIYKVLKNNYLCAKWQEIAPAVVDILNEYAGKPYGEKTAEKMRQALYKRAGCYMHIERGRAWRMWIKEATPQGYTDPSGAEFNIYANKAEFLTDNKINAIALDSWILSGVKPYAADPAALVEKLKDQRKQARALWEQLATICREYNNAAPEGFDHLDPYRPASI